MGIQFYKKSIYDLSYTNPTTTVTDATATNTGESFTDFLRNRDNFSGWATTGSNDAANTTLVIDFIDNREFDSIMLLKHNFKAFTIKYWNGSTWTDFSTAISETTNTQESNYYNFTLVESTKLQIIITGTQTADSDKFLRQLLVCEKLGELTEEPEVTVEIGKQRKQFKFLSGKSFMSTQVGGASIKLRKQSMKTDADLTLIETLYNSFQGFHVSLSGGTTTQFEFNREGYRREDIYFCQCANEYEPNYRDGRYKHGVDVMVSLVEVS